MAREWTIKLKGGPWDGQDTTYPLADPVLIAWTCEANPDCAGHFTMDPNAAGIIFKRATAYNRTERDEEKRTAVYEVGEGLAGNEDVEERELVGAGAGFDEGYRTSRAWD